MQTAPPEPRWIPADPIFAGLLGCSLVLASGISATHGIPLIRSAPAIALTAYFILRVFAHRVRARVLPWHWASLLWVCLLAAGILYTRSPVYAAWKTAIVALYWLAFAVSFSSLFGDGLSVRSFLRGMLAGGLLYALLVFAYAGSPQDLFRDAGVYFRLRLGGENPIYVARALGLTVLVALWYCSGPGRRRLQVAVAVVIPALLAYMVLTGSRGPALALCAAVAVFAIARIRRKLFLVPMLGGLALAGTLLVRSPQLGGGRLRLLDFGGNAMYNRVLSWRLGLEGFGRAGALRLLFGSGTGDFSHPGVGADVRYYPHNIFIESLYENGLVGVVLLAAITIVPIIMVSRAGASRLTADYRSLKGMIAAALALAVFSVVNALLTGDLATNTWIPIAGAMLVALRESALHSRVAGDSSVDLAVPGAWKKP